MNARMPAGAVALACTLAAILAGGAPADARDLPAGQHRRQPSASPPPAPASSTAPAAMQGMPMAPASPQPAAREPPPAPATATPAARPHTLHMPSMPPATDAGGRSPDYSDGYGRGSMPGMDMADDPLVGMLLVDRLEYRHARGGGSAVAVDGEAWYGRNFDKLWLKFEGERAAGRLHDFRGEALWSHALAPFWDAQVGVRHDFGAGSGRTWAAFGVEGLAPYRFETEATLYVGQGGRTAARIAFEYEARVTQRLVLQPSLEANFYGRDDPGRGLGAGLSDVEAGLRLRYEIRREFAPYLGLVRQQRFGRSRGYARALGDSDADWQFVAGVRVWF